MSGYHKYFNDYFTEENTKEGIIKTLENSTGADPQHLTRKSLAKHKALF